MAAALPRPAAPGWDPSATLKPPAGFDKWPTLLTQNAPLPSLDASHLRYPAWLQFLPLPQQASVMLSANCRAPWNDAILNAWRQRLIPADMMSLAMPQSVITPPIQPPLEGRQSPRNEEEKKISSVN
eukprot:GHVO01068404.1.p1 GENE.GHVO01068404.1~~GHVO01068404.1.p1  ORF type:complete len:127 (-),score=14.36 GHVO01068404.1:118-498(-)